MVVQHVEFFRNPREEASLEGHRKQNQHEYKIENVIIRFGLVDRQDSENDGCSSAQSGKGNQSPVLELELAEWKQATVLFKYHESHEIMLCSIPQEHTGKKIEIEVIEKMTLGHT